LQFLIPASSLGCSLTIKLNADTIFSAAPPMENFWFPEQWHNSEIKDQEKRGWQYINNTSTLNQIEEKKKQGPWSNRSNGSWISLCIFHSAWTFFAELQGWRYIFSKHYLSEAPGMWPKYCPFFPYIYLVITWTQVQ
jgi:hypothetical protein